MKESYREGLASHPGPESCGEVVRPNPKRGQGYRQAGLASSENGYSRAPTQSRDAEGHTGAIAIARTRPARRSRRTLAQVWKLLAREPGGPGGAGGEKPPAGKGKR